MSQEDRLYRKHVRQTQSLSLMMISYTLSLIIVPLTRLIVLKLKLNQATGILYFVWTSRYLYVDKFYEPILILTNNKRLQKTFFRFVASCLVSIIYFFQQFVEVVAKFWHTNQIAPQN